jgi:hypothetical protein
LFQLHHEAGWKQPDIPWLTRSGNPSKAERATALNIFHAQQRTCIRLKDEPFRE